MSRRSSAAAAAAEPSSRGGGIISAEDYEDALRPKRGYTTRGQVEAAAKAAPIFTGLVRRWEKKWVKQGHMTVLKWERIKTDGPENGRGAEATSEAVASARKRQKAGS